MPATTAACPHCAVVITASQRQRWGVLLGLAGAASLGLTMMACYGAPICKNTHGECNPDASGDGGSHDSGSPDGGVAH